MHTTLASMMTRDVHTVASSDTVAELEAALSRYGLSGAPVTDAGCLVGVISHADVVRQLAVEEALEGYVSDWYHVGERAWSSTPEGQSPLASEDLSERTVGEFMSTPALSIAVDASPKDAASMMLEHRVHRLVVTERDAVVGVVSTMDMLRVVAEG